MKELLHSLVVPLDGAFAPLYTLRGRLKIAMAAAAALSSPFSSQEHHSLPIRSHLDDPFSPPPSGQSNLIRDNALPLGTSPFAGLANLQDIDDFDRQHPYQPKLVRLQSKNKASCDNIINLQHLCDKQQIRPAYECEEVYPQNFKAKVTVAGETFEVTALFPSKDQARDAAAKIAIERWQVLANKQAAGVKRKPVDRSPSPIDKTEDWISILNITALQKKRFKPNYEDYSTESPPYGFSCKIRLDGGRMQPFEVGLFASKRDARTACAKLAVEWLRSENHIATPTKRPKHNDGDSAHTGVTQALAAMDVDGQIQPESPKSRQRLHNLVVSMGLRQPEFKLQRSTTTGAMSVSAPIAMYDVAAVFHPDDVRREPALAGPLGEEAHVFGKDNAREACAKNLLPVLEKIKQSMML